MSDSDLKEFVYAALGGIILFGLLFTVASSEAFQKHRFLDDCGQRHSRETCVTIWNDANGLVD